MISSSFSVLCFDMLSILVFFIALKSSTGNVLISSWNVISPESCLEHRSLCLRDSRCSRHFDSFERTCGYSLGSCSVPSPSDCVLALRKLRNFFPHQKCVCFGALGLTEDCDFFRELIWNHPCERKLVNAGKDHLQANNYDQREYFWNSLPFPTSPGVRRRTTRMPLTDQVHQWKSQLSGDLETREKFSKATCDQALNELCLQHVSCRQLWRLFRSSCGVDEENKCTMADRDICWQSFEGLSWTGLGNCRCDSNNSDCHWIRLHTNYNKCIYEISKSDHMSPARSSYRTAQQYQQQYEIHKAQETHKPFQNHSYQPITYSTTSSPLFYAGRTTMSYSKFMTSTRPPMPSRYSGQGASRNISRTLAAPSMTYHQQANNYTPSPPSWFIQSTSQSQEYYKLTAPHIPRYRLNGTSQGVKAAEVYSSQRTFSTPSPTSSKSQIFNRPVYNQPNKEAPYSTSLQALPTSGRHQDEYRNSIKNSNAESSPSSSSYYVWNTDHSGYNQSPMTTSSIPHHGNVDSQIGSKSSNKYQNMNDRIIQSNKNRDRDRLNPTYYQDRLSTLNQQSNPRASIVVKAHQQETRRTSVAKDATSTLSPDSSLTNPDSRIHIKGNSSVGFNRSFSSERLTVTVPIITTSASPTTTMSTSPTTTTTPASTTTNIPTYVPPATEAIVTTSASEKRIEFPVRFEAKTPTESSSCQLALNKCDQTEDCRWHLGELRVRCSRASCRRDDCASALQRFSRYVPYELVEEIMFCQCSANDKSCSEHQDILYPKCLYSSSQPVPTCTQTNRKCESDPRCRQLLHSISNFCPVLNGECATTTNLAQCRQTLLTARASILEQPCFCPFSDVECISYQRLMIPNNPCIEKSMLDYSRVYLRQPQLTTRSPNFETNRVQDLPPAVVKSDEVHYKQNSEYQENTPSQQFLTSTVETELSLITTPMPPLISVLNKQSGKKTTKKFRTTTVPPPTTSEAPPPWVTTTTAAPTTTTTFMTHAPPPPEGCTTRDANGRWIFAPVGTVIRRYLSWSGRCSSFCECKAENDLSCEKLPCLEEGNCEAPMTLVNFGERIYLKERGACFCESSQFICEYPEEMPELYPGLYISAGYSVLDVEMLRKEVPSPILEKAGFLSADGATDIASRLQIAFERLLPEDIQCRIVLLPELSEPGSAFLRVEWYGMNTYLNQTKVQWYHGGAEKVCSPFITKLADQFAQGDSLRYQLVLSTVKQIRVIDYLDGLPKSLASTLVVSMLRVISFAFVFHLFFIF